MEMNLKQLRSLLNTKLYYAGSKDSKTKTTSGMVQKDVGQRHHRAYRSRL